MQLRAANVGASRLDKPRLTVQHPSATETPPESSPTALRQKGRTRASGHVSMSTMQANSFRGNAPVAQGSSTLRRSDNESVLVKGGRNVPPRKSASRLSADPDKRQFKIEDFTFIRVLGQGSFGIVKLVCDRETNHLFALKCLNKSNIRGKKHIEHIKNERMILSKFCRTDFCCTIEGSMQDEQQLYMVLEYLPGGELIKQMRKQVFMSEEDTRFYLAEIVLAVERLHERGVIYRDLKPENILIDA